MHFNVKPVKNKNTPEYIHEIKQKAFEHLRYLDNNPGVPFHNIPTMAFQGEREQEDREEQKNLASLVQKRGMDEE